MRKIWIFVEGDSEEEFVANLLFKEYSDSIYICKDILEFVDTDLSTADFYSCYVENCSGIDKIPHRINEIDYLITKSSSDKILIVGDLEDLPCFGSRLEKILEILNDNIPRTNIKTVFFKPRIEKDYWDCQSVIERIIQLDYREKFRTQQNPTINIPRDIDKDIYGLKKAFRDHDVKYHESRFAKKFFPRVNFDCNNARLQRIKGIINDFVQN
jgi:hypothetical protein